ncbi:MAG TPA: OpcA/G6PD domain-containing protein, partial [Gaiellales bacterium]|nr:OpcA/G6PD domain-containing protein [Gaiellales bacterium]
VVGPIDQARLLAGWLRSRLRARVDLRHLPSDTLERVAVIAGGRFTVERTGRPGVGRTKDAAGGECPVMLAGRTLADQLATELDRLGRDRVFEQALEAA